MTLYPKADSRDPRWGGQRPGRVVIDGDVRRLVGDGEVGIEQAFTPLDSEASAVARMLAALEAGLPKHSVRNRGLDGSDDVATVGRLLDEIEAEVVACRGVSPADHATVDSYTEALPVKYLDPAKWYAGIKAEYGVSTYADLRVAVAPAVVMEK